MKLHKTTSIVIQGMLMLGMLGACQNEDALAPENPSAISGEDRGAKISADAPKLVKDGDFTLQYVKSGRYTGRLSKVSEPFYYTDYSYSDGSAAGDFWITSKRYNSANALVKELQYHIVNGRCVKVLNKTNNQNHIFEYNEMGRLDRILREGGSEKREFFYIYNSTAGAERLSKIVSSNSNGTYQETQFYYTSGSAMGGPKTDKYFLNPEHTELDPYLPVFGKFSDLLVKQVIVTPLPYNGQLIPFYAFAYFFNADGYVSLRWRNHYPFGQNSTTNMTSKSFEQKYLANPAGL